MTTVSTGRRDDRAKVRTLLHEAESARLLIEVVPRNDRSPIIADARPNGRGRTATCLPNTASRSS